MPRQVRIIREGLAAIPVNMLWKKSYKTNRRKAAGFDAALNHDNSCHSAIRVSDR